ncbi:hypothetical protein AOLI_G00160540 [Acnodon oligacanthus]
MKPTGGGTAPRELLGPVVESLLGGSAPSLRIGGIRRIPALSSTVLIWTGVLLRDLPPWRFWTLSATIAFTSFAICFYG